MIEQLINVVSQQLRADLMVFRRKGIREHFARNYIENRPFPMGFLTQGARSSWAYRAAVLAGEAAVPFVTKKPGNQSSGEPVADRPELDPAWA